MSWNDILSNIEKILDIRSLVRFNPISDPTRINNFLNRLMFKVTDIRHFYIANRQQCLEIMDGVFILRPIIMKIRTSEITDQKKATNVAKYIKELKIALKEAYQLIWKNVLPSDLVWLEKKFWIANQVINMYKIAQAFNEIKLAINANINKLLSDIEYVEITYPIFNTFDDIDPQTSDYIQLKEYLTNNDIDENIEVDEILAYILNFLEPLSEKQAMDMFLESRNRSDSDSKLQNLYEYLKKNKQFQYAHQLKILNSVLDQHREHDKNGSQEYTYNWNSHLEVYSSTITQQMSKITDNLKDQPLDLRDVINKMLGEDLDSQTKDLLEAVKKIYVPSVRSYQINFLAPEKVWKYRFPAFSLTDLDIKFDAHHYIGQGAGGIVYSGHIKNEERVPIAFKKLKMPDLMETHVIKNTNNIRDIDSISIHGPAESEQEFVQSIEKALHHEVRIAWSLSGHPNCVKLYGVCLNPLGLIFEYCNSGKLKDLLYKTIYNKELMMYTYTKAEKLTLQQKISGVGQLIQGVYFLHSKGFTHRDIKSSNCLVHNYGIKNTPILSFKLTDFGSVKTIVDFIHSSPFSHSSSLKLQTSGTPFWMAPERYNTSMTPSERKIIENSPAVDIYSLGCLIGEIFLEQPPFVNYKNEQDIKNAFRIHDQVYPHDMILLSKISHNLTDIIAQCCNPDPNKRCTIMKLVHQLWPGVHKQLTNDPQSQVHILPTSSYEPQTYIKTSVSAKIRHENPYIKVRIIYDLTKSDIEDNYIEVEMRINPNSSISTGIANIFLNKNIMPISPTTVSSLSGTIQYMGFPVCIELVEQNPHNPVVSIPITLYCYDGFLQQKNNLWVLGRDYLQYFETKWTPLVVNLTLLSDHKFSYIDVDKRRNATKDIRHLSDQKLLSFEKDINKRLTVLVSVKNDGCALLYAPTELKNDREIVFTAVENDNKAFQYASKNLRSNKQFVLAILKKCYYSGQILQYISEELKTDRDIILAALKLDGKILGYTTLELRNDKDLVLVAVQENGYALEYASDKLRNDKHVVFAAVQQNGRALEYASDKLRNDKHVVLEAVRQNGRALEYTSSLLRSNQYVILAAVQNSSWNSLYKSSELMKDKNFILAAVQQNSQVLQYISSELRSNQNFILSAIQINYQVLEYASDQLKNNLRFMLLAIENNHQALKYASNQVKRDLELMLSAS